MSTADSGGIEDRVVVLAPTGSDAALTRDFLEKAEIAVAVCRDLSDLTEKVAQGCAAIVVAEEALDPAAIKRLVAQLKAQPSWSELPITLITSGGEVSARESMRLSIFGANANVTLLERPFRPVTLVNTLRAAVRSRRRQYQVRDLLEERERVLKSINDAFVTLDREWCYTYVNEKAAELLGRPRDELIGVNLWKLFPNYVGTQLHRELISAAAEHKSTRFEYPHSDGQRWLDFRVYPTPGGVSILTVDVTDRKLAEEQLEAKVEERTLRLRETIAELEAFSYSISHDLRSPLRAMQAYSQALIEDFGTVIPEDGRRYVERIASASVRLDKLITDLLTYSQVLRAPLSLQPIELDELVHTLIEQYPSFQPHKNHIRIESPLANVMGHEGSLTQCITNLTGNALKFVPADRSPDVRIWTEARDDQVRVVFADNGIGIAPRDQARVFGMFQRVHPEKHYEGTGIGLSIVRKAVERMGGTLGLESEEGVGSRFWIQLPKG